MAAPQPVCGTVHGVQFKGHIVMRANPNSWDEDDHAVQPVFEGVLTFNCSVCNKDHCVITTLHGREKFPALVNGTVHCAVCHPREFGVEIIDYFIN